MSEPLAEEIERLRSIFASVEIPFVTKPGATDHEIDAVEGMVGIRFDEDLRSMWRFSNGSGGDGPWFVAMSDELTGCNLASLSESADAWRFFADYNRSDVAEKDVNEVPWDARIRPGSLYRQSWFPVVQFNGFSTAVHFDAEPSESGRYGQLVVYQHDPESVYYMAESFTEFFRKSNKLLETRLTEQFFLGDEYARICHMNGTKELERQLAAGLVVTQRNWEGYDLRATAVRAGRSDLVDYLDGHKY